MLPFTADVLFSVVAQYNRAVWPAQIIAYGLGLVAVLLTFRPILNGDRFIGALLAAAWAWIGVAYYLMHVAVIDFAAPAYAAAFVIQGLLFAWTAAIRGKITFRFRPTAVGWAGLAFVFFAMAVYPLVGWLAGHGWPRAPLFGVTPGPTSIFTIGMLLLAEGRTPLHLVVLPVLWLLAGGAMAWLLNIPEDIVLPLVGIGGLCLILWKNRHRAKTA